MQLKKGIIKAQLTAGNITLEIHESVGLKEKLLGVGGVPAGIQAVNSARNYIFYLWKKRQQQAKLQANCTVIYINSMLLMQYNCHVLISPNCIY